MKTLCCLLLIISSLLSCEKPPAKPQPDYSHYAPAQKAFLAAATGNTKLLEEALASGISPNAVDESGVPLLQRCLGPKGSNEAVKSLLEKGADVNQVSSFGDTALMEACMWLNEEAIQLLLKKGADPNAQNKDGETPLHRMGFAGKTTINSIKLLVEAGAKLDLKQKDGETILQHFSQEGDEIITYLKSNGAA